MLCRNYLGGELLPPPPALQQGEEGDVGAGSLPVLVGMGHKGWFPGGFGLQQ